MTISPNPQGTILIVEDDLTVFHSISSELADLGLAYEHATDGQSGLEMALERNFPLVILDLGLPKLGGLEVCRRIREKRPTQAILIVTGEHDETSTVLSLELGADDYITKPFRRKEFRARVRALLRRITALDSQPEETTPANQSIELLDFHLDYEKCQFRFKEQVIKVTPTEFELLALFLREPERIYSREELLDSVWGSVASGYEQNVRSHLSRLRKKIVDAGYQGELFLNIRGFGYRFFPEQT